jgi:hypothetical protein
MMNVALTLGEIDLVVVAENHNPSVLNPDFLLRTGIVDPAWKWELAGSPLSTPQFSQVTFKSGTSIQAFLERLIFRDRNRESIAADPKFATIAAKYVETLPHVSYTAIGVNPKVHVITASDEEAERFLIDRLIANGPWRDFSGGPTDASVNLSFHMPDCQFTVSIATGRMRTRDKNQSPCLVFAGNFHRDLKGESHAAKHQHLLASIAKWREDAETFTRFIQERVLGSAK